MTASFEGHVDVVRILIEANSQVNTQKEVCCYHHKKLCTFVTHFVHRMAGLLFTWQLKKAKLTW